MRQIVLDTETTGLDAAQGHRIVEIGALELINAIPTGQTFHRYLNPERDMPPEAQAVHGLTTAFLRDKPVFAEIAGELLAFLGDDGLIIHNASFDLGFLNAELSFRNLPAIPRERVVDTLHLARQKHPAGPNSLDALCKRYGIDNSRRTKHGALLDSELLAEIYLELIGGRQQALSLTASRPREQGVQATVTNGRPRPQRLNSRITELERANHAAFVETLGSHAMWKQKQG